MIDSRKTGGIMGVISFLCIAALPLNNLQIGGISIYKYLIIGILAATVLVFLYMSGTVRIQTAELFWIVYVLYGSVISVFSENGDGLGYAVGMLQLCAMCVLILQFQEYSKKTLLAGFFVCGIVMVYMLLVLSEEQRLTDRNLITFGDLGKIDPNEWCACLIVPLAACTYYAFKAKHLWKRVVLIGLEAFAFYTILLTGSRGGLLSNAVVVLIVSLRAMRASWKTMVIVPVFVALAAFAFFKWILPNVSQTLMERFTLDAVVETGGTGRIDIWKDAVKMMLSDPFRMIFGRGFFGASSNNCTHNQLLQVLLDSGIIGFSLYIAMLYHIYKRAKANGEITLASFWGVQVALLTLSAYAYFKMIWMVYLFCLLQFRKDNKTRISGCAGAN